MAILEKALKTLFLDKKARAALEAKAAAPRPQQSAHQDATQGTEQAPQRQPQKTAPPHPSREELYARLDQAQQASTQRSNTAPDRQQLIQSALKVRANKAQMLEELPEEQRRKLQALAMMSFMKSRPGG